MSEILEFVQLNKGNFSEIKKIEIKERNKKENV